MGGASSIRAFAIREIGPGTFPGFKDKAYSYLMQNGEIRFVCNLEYRHRLFGNLHGAIFLDAGNVWNFDDNFEEDFKEIVDFNTKFRFKDFLRELAVGTGIGLRYDLDFLVLRLDWGIGLHVPYKTDKSGFYNMPNFKNSHTLNFAIGYPF